jgi:hypothetical protein
MLPVTTSSVDDNSFEKLNPERELAVAISFLSRIGAEIQVLPVCRPPCWILQLPVIYCSVVDNFVEKMFPKDAGLAVEILFLSHICRLLFTFQLGCICTPLDRRRRMKILKPTAG